MGPEKRRILLMMTVTVGVGSHLSAFGQEPLPVFVEFDFGRVTPLKNSPTAAEYERKVAETVAICFTQPPHREFFPWRIQAGSSTSFPKIKLTLVEDPRMTRWELRVEAYKENGGLTDKVLPLQRIVSEPGDLEIRRGKRRTPRSEEFPKKVKDWLESRFLQPGSREDLQRLMMAVAPLGDCLVLARAGTPRGVDEAEGVLELDWDNFMHLSNSRFIVICEEKDRSHAELGSNGDLKPGEFELSGRKGLGIAIKHKTWNNREIVGFLPRLDQLSTGRVYLEKYIPWRGMPRPFGARATDQ
jgi:hypothetical protein